MIIVKLSGGLGNQMFQYATAKALALKKNTQVKLDLTTLNHRLPMRGYVFRTYDLDLFNVKVEISWLSKLSKYVKNLAFVLSKVQIKIKNIFLLGSVFKEKEYYFFDENIFNQSADVYLDGFWQSYKYFETCQGLIRQEFSFRLPLSEKGRKLAEKISNCQSVCINIRRGDYVANKNNIDFFGILPLEYFQQGMDLIKQKIENPYFFIFTDDIEWCQENFNLSENVFFVTGDYNGERYIEKFHLMTLCRHFIIPNSTYGWWGAWLAKNPDKIVVAPKKWVADEKLNNNTKDLIPLDWIRI
jgi:hypothetical protein